ncbi:MAG TPA: zinc-binding dehydrogenase [Anaerolineae bacterium]|nr:zinc-binding dehydrogenase [Anaerolineae bacterium]
MPLELVVASPRKIAFVEYEDRDPLGNEVLVQTTVSGIKHGTELNTYRGVVPFADQVWDTHLRVFRPLHEDERSEPFFPHKMGSWAAGVVTKVGPAVCRFKPGDRVHGEWKHRQTVIMTEDRLYPIKDSVADEVMVFTDPARFALAGIHDAAIKLGDRVAIFGLGAIGMLALPMARLSGAGQIFAVDPIPARLELTRQFGADVTDVLVRIDPLEREAGLAIKEASGGAGADVALEISGGYAALQQALRCVHREGLVVTVSFYGDNKGRVDLSSEWHHNRITLRSSMPVWGCSHRCYPLWDMARIERTAIGLLEEGRLPVEPLTGARIPFERAAQGYAMIDESPGDNVKVLLTYT